MNWELAGVLGVVGGLLLLAWRLSVAEVKAAAADQYKQAAKDLGTLLDATRDVAASKEDYIRELEKTVLGTLPAGKLAERLSLQFSAKRRQGADAVLPTKRAPKSP